MKGEIERLSEVATSVGGSQNPQECERGWENKSPARIMRDIRG